MSKTFKVHSNQRFVPQNYKQFKVLYKYTQNLQITLKLEITTTKLQFSGRNFQNFLYFLFKKLQLQPNCIHSTTLLHNRSNLALSIATDNHRQTKNQHQNANITILFNHTFVLYKILNPTQLLYDFLDNNIQYYTIFFFNFLDNNTQYYINFFKTKLQILLHIQIRIQNIGMTPRIHAHYIRKQQKIYFLDNSTIYSYIYTYNTLFYNIRSLINTIRTYVFLQHGIKLCIYYYFFQQNFVDNSGVYIDTYNSGVYTNSYNTFILHCPQHDRDNIPFTQNIKHLNHIHSQQKIKCARVTYRIQENQTLHCIIIHQEYILYIPYTIYKQP
eukprot:TRINITY_DN6686_c1_g2_i2.p1 TRINITY_DN6686_c1_g2~~TRINITY_DN6686_c1_g2_i2.p1  ORF type:complete len:362 (+),score=-40.26 TRINITY_DN6686_c1_g2_i2:105-1088(+)